MVHMISSVTRRHSFTRECKHKRNRTHTQNTWNSSDENEPVTSNALKACTYNGLGILLESTDPDMSYGVTSPCNSLSMATHYMNKYTDTRTCLHPWVRWGWVGLSSVWRPACAGVEVYVVGIGFEHLPLAHHGISNRLVQVSILVAHRRWQVHSVSVVGALIGLLWVIELTVLKDETRGHFSKWRSFVTLNNIMLKYNILYFSNVNACLLARNVHFYGPHSQIILYHNHLLSKLSTIP